MYSFSPLPALPAAPRRRACTSCPHWHNRRSHNGQAVQWYTRPTHNGHTVHWRYYCPTHNGHTVPARALLPSHIGLLTTGSSSE